MKKTFVEDWTPLKDIDLCRAFVGFSHKGYKVIPVSPSEDFLFTEFQVAADTPVVGSLGLVRNGLRQLKTAFPFFPPYPNPLRRFMDREPKESSLSAVLTESQDLGFHPVFVKPSVDKGLFRGFVVRGTQDLLNAEHAPDDTRVWKLREIPWLAEYRMFFLRGSLIWTSFYKGDPAVAPDSYTMRRIATAASNIEADAFSLDVGVAHFPTRPEKIRNPTLLITANDAFSFEGYGLPPDLYANMLEARWEQMTRRY